MRSRKTSIRIVFFIVILLSVISITNKNNDVYAKTNDFQIKSNVLIKYNGTDGNVIIPNGVVKIQHGAFYGNTKIKSITMPSSVTEIEDYPNDQIGGAFAGCSSLSSISLSKNLSHIGSYAFSGCTSFKSINFPDSLSYIGAYAFDGCKSLKVITLPDEIITIEKGTFKNCTSLQKIVLSNKTSEICDEAFSGCSSLSDIIFPSGLHTIGKLSFSKCKSLQRVHITKNIAVIGTGAFSYCSGLKFFEIDEENIFFKVIDGALYNISQSVLYAYPANSKNTKFNILQETKIIADYAFSDAKNLTTVTLSDNITGIYPFTFANCKKLNNINIPSATKAIGEGAFTNCTNLKKIEIPEGLLKIGDFGSTGAFNGCTGLSAITIPSTVKIVYEGTFNKCTNIKSIVLKEGVEIFYGSNVSSNLEKITLPKSLVKLEGNQFIGTKWYKKSNSGWVYLGKHLIDFKEDKTHVASKITSYTVKAGTVSINDEAFNNMDKLMKLTMPKSVIYYNYDEDYAGKYDKPKDGSNLENTYWYLNQPNGVVYVGSVAFRLKNEGGGFSINLNYGSKEEVEIANKKAELRKKYKLITFGTISFKKGTVSVADNFANKVNTDDFNLKYIFPSSLKLIGAKAFEHNYYSIQKITWNANLKYIENDAFALGCVEENKLFKNFPSNTRVIGDNILYAELNEIDIDYAQIQWMTDEIVSQYLDYDKESKTLTIKTNIPYMEKIDNSFITGSSGFQWMDTIFYENIIIPEEMECIADYLFGYGNWSNPNLKFTKSITDSEGNEFDQNGVFRKNPDTGQWETIALGDYTNDPFEYYYSDYLKALTWDAQIGFWIADFID